MANYLSFKAYRAENGGNAASVYGPAAPGGVRADARTPRTVTDGRGAALVKRD